MTALKKPLKPSIRQAAIVEALEKSGRASVEKLAERFGTSQETVRRDLNALAEVGRARKIHGGAVRVSVAREDSFEERLKKNLRAKQEVAEKVARLIHPGQSIMIDTGSATLLCAEAFSRLRDLTVITNSTKIADTISSAKNGSKAILLGGRYRSDNAQTVGPQTCAEIAHYRTDHVLLTVSALDQQGAYDVTEDEAQVARAMIANADCFTIVADNTKLGKASTYRICELSDMSRVILDAAPGAAFQAACRSAGVEIL